MSVGGFVSFAGFLALASSLSQAQAEAPGRSNALPALRASHCDNLPLFKALVPTPPEKRDKNGQYTNGAAGLPDGLDTGTMGFFLRSRCYTLLFLEDKGRVLEDRLAQEGVSTILSDIRAMVDIRSTLLHPVYQDKTGDVLSKHLLKHAERALNRLLTLPLKDEKGRELLSPEARAKLAQSPTEIAQTLPSKQFADAEEVQREILFQADKQNFNTTSERQEREEKAQSTQEAAEKKSEPKTAAVPQVNVTQALSRNLADIKNSQPQIERAAAPALSAAPGAVAMPAAASAAKPAVHVEAKKVEGVIPGSYPGHTPDGKPCTVLIQSEGLWYGQRVPMFKAQIIVGDLKPGSQVQDHEFAEVSFGQQSASSAAGSIKARTTVGELLALRRKGELLPDPVVRSKSLAGDSLNAFVESYAYKYDRAGDRRVNDKGELVRRIGARGEATVHLVRQKTSMAAKIKNGVPTEMTLTTHSGDVDQDVTAGSYVQWRKSSMSGNFDAGTAITCLTDKEAPAEPKFMAPAGEQH